MFENIHLFIYTLKWPRYTYANVALMVWLVASDFTSTNFYQNRGIIWHWNLEAVQTVHELPSFRFEGVASLQASWRIEPSIVDDERIRFISSIYFVAPCCSLFVHTSWSISVSKSSLVWFCHCWRHLSHLWQIFGQRCWKSCLEYAAISASCQWDCWNWNTYHIDHGLPIGALPKQTKVVLDGKHAIHKPQSCSNEKHTNGNDQIPCHKKKLGVKLRTMGLATVRYVKEHLSSQIDPPSVTQCQTLVVLQFYHLLQGQGRWCQDVGSHSGLELAARIHDLNGRTA